MLIKLSLFMRKFNSGEISEDACGCVMRETIHQAAKLTFQHCNTISIRLFKNGNRQKSNTHQNQKQVYCYYKFIILSIENFNTRRLCLCVVMQYGQNIEI